MFLASAQNIEVVVKNTVIHQQENNITKMILAYNYFICTFGLLIFMY